MTKSKNKALLSKAKTIDSSTPQVPHLEHDITKTASPSWLKISTHRFRKTGATTSTSAFSVTPTLYLLSLLLTSLLLTNTGCGPQRIDPGIINTNQNTDSSSRLDVPDNQVNTPKDIALCNRLQDPLITAQLMVFYDQNNIYHPDLLRVYIPQIHPDFANSSYQILFRKWKASVSGETYQDNTPLKFWAEKKLNRMPSTPQMDGLQWNLLSFNLEKTLNTTFTLSDAFSQFSFVIDLKDPTASFDVLKISLYKDGALVKDKEWNVLLPAFYAHPATYASNQNSVLAHLHPFYGQESSSFSTDFATQLNGYCF